MKNKRDYLIELLRFGATAGIAIFHFEWIYLGHPVFFRHFYLWVEFFFVLSGFFMAKNFLDNKDDKELTPFLYTVNQAKKLWIPYFIAFIFSFIVYCIANNIESILDILELIWKSKWEIFYLQLSGFDLNAPVINGVTAYIPALLFSDLILYYLLSKHYKLVINVLIPIAPICIYSHIINTYGNLSQWMPYENWYTIGILRGLAGMLVGIGGYIYGKEFILNMRKNIRYVLISFCILGIITLVVLHERVSYQDEVLYPYTFAILIACCYFRNKRNMGLMIFENICIKFGGISYNIFLIHYGICYLFLIYLPKKEYFKIAPVYLIIVILMGLLMEIVLNRGKMRKGISKK